MIKSIKKAMATLAALALFVTSAGPVFAQTYNDVPTNAWYYEYVEQLVDEGVFDVGDYFRPNDPLNRAELMKIAITSIDGLLDYEAPATPTFDDVPTNAWYFDYIEASVQLGIVEGYTDAAGNLTGMFGPGDTVNRAAATKILVNAFAVPTTLTPASMFPDVSESAWFYDYVVTAYNQSILDGYDDGRFGPADPVTRAQVAKLTVNSMDPLLREDIEEEEEEEEEEEMSEGALEVSLNDDTSPSSTVPQQASNVQLTSFDFTAADDDVVISNVVVTRGGVGQTGDWEALYLYDGASRLTTGRSINNDTNTATFAFTLLVEAGTTRTLSVVGDVSATPGSSNQHYFYIASVADVTSNAQDVIGDFPVAGNTFTIGGAGTVVNTLTIARGTAPSQPQIGAQDAEIASVRMTAGPANDVAIHSLVLSQAGSLSSAKMINCRFLRSTDEVATSEGFDGDRVTFILDTPYVIPEGQTKTFYVRCDIDGGRTTDNVRLYLDENTDISAIDQQFGYGAVITNTFNTTAQTNPISLKGGDVTVTDNGPVAAQLAQNSTNNELLNFSLTTDRDLTVRNTFIQIDLRNIEETGPTIGLALGTDLIDDDDEESGAIAADNDTGEFCVNNNTDFEVGDMVSVPTANGTEYAIITSVDLDDADCDAGGGTTDDKITTNSTSTSAVVDGEAIVEVNPYDYVRNVRLIDLDAGNTLAGPMTDANDGATLVAGVPSSYNRVHTEDYELIGGDSRHLSVQVDLDQNMPSGYIIRAQVRFSDTGIVSYLKDMDANEFVSTEDVVGAGQAALAGKWMTSAANNLAVARSSTPTSQTYVKGETSVPSLGVALTSGDAGDITVKRLIIRAYAINNTDDGGGLLDDASGGVQGWDDLVGNPGVWENVLGNIAANTYAASVTIYDGDDVVAGPEGLGLIDGAGGLAGSYDAGVDYYKSQFDDLNLVIEKGATRTLVAKINLLNTMTGPVYLTLDIDPANDVIAEDADANTVSPTGLVLNGATTKVPLITIDNSGTLTASSEGNPDAVNVVAGASGQLAAKYRFHALREGWDVNKITIINSPVTDAADVWGGAAANNLVGAVLPTPSTFCITGDPTATLLIGNTIEIATSATSSVDAIVDAITLDVAGAICAAGGDYRIDTSSSDAATDITGLGNPIESATAFGTGVATTSIGQVTIKFPDINGVQQSKTATLSQGSATLSGLDFYVPSGEDAFLEVYADVNSMAGVGETLSGQTYRLGLQDNGNDVGSFEAVGAASSSTDNFRTGNEVANATSIETFVIRKTVPTFVKASGSVNLINGENTLYGVTVSADSAGPMSFGRMVFDITTNGLDGAGGEDIDEFRFYRGSTPIDVDDVEIWCEETAQTDVQNTAGLDVCSGGGGDVPNNTYKIVVSFDQEETVAAGSSQTYYLKASIAGADTNDSVTAKVANGDEAVAMTVLTNNNGNTNTSYISDDTGADLALFGNAGSGCGSTASTTAFADEAAGLPCNVVWSDKSADAHLYATIAAGSVTDASGSYDWTNGYLLKITNLSSHTLSF